MSERGKGQPRAFDSAEAFQNAFMEYIDYCIEKKRFPNIAGFCAFKRITRDTFYMQKEYYSDTYNIVRDVLEDEVLQDNTYRAQLYLKNVFGYKDKQEVTSTNVNISGEDLTEEEARKILKTAGVEL